MTAMTQDRDTRKLGSQLQPTIFDLPVAANGAGFGGGIVCLNAARYAVNGQTNPSLLAIGRAKMDYSNVGGANGAITVHVESGCFKYANSSGLDLIAQANVGAMAFVVDDQTVALTDGNGTRSPAGPIVQIDSDGVWVQFQLPALAAQLPTVQLGANAANKARAVVTSMPAYTGSGTGTLTAVANGALATQDGVSTLAVGDVVFVQAGTANVTAVDAGPFAIVSLGSAGSQVVLQRPDWYTNASTIPVGYTVDLGPEGTVFGGNQFKSFAVKGAIVGTTSPLFFPRVFKKTVTLALGVYTVGAGGGGEPLALASTTTSIVQVTQNTVGGTIGTGRLVAPVANRIAGAAGTAAVQVQSLSSTGTLTTTDTSTVDVLITNY